jgi:hypothetical protein
MKKILLVGQKLEINSPAVRYGETIAKKEDAEVVFLFVVPSSITTPDWMDTQERDVEAALKKAKEIEASLKRRFDEEGIRSSFRAIRFEPGIFKKEMAALMPADLIVAGQLEFSHEVAEQGITSIADLGAAFSCPVIDAQAMKDHFKPVPKKLWLKFMLYGTGSAFMYFGFFPYVKHLNNFFMTNGFISGLAIMGVVATHAWVYGNATECLPKFIKMDH